MSRRGRKKKKDPDPNVADIDEVMDTVERSDVPCINQQSDTEEPPSDKVPVQDGQGMPVVTVTLVDISLNFRELDTGTVQCAPRHRCPSPSRNTQIPSIGEPIDRGRDPPDRSVSSADNSALSSTGTVYQLPLENPPENGSNNEEEQTHVSSQPSSSSTNANNKRRRPSEDFSTRKKRRE